MHKNQNLKHSFYYQVIDVGMCLLYTRKCFFYYQVVDCVACVCCIQESVSFTTR